MDERGGSGASWRPTRQLGVGAVDISPLEKRYVNEVLDSNRLSYGDMSRRFEDGFARVHGVRHAVISSSGTGALHVALASLKERHGWEDGDEVLVPACTFVATANVVLMTRLEPVFVDVDPRTYTIDPSLIEQHLGPRTRAIIPVHAFGLPADMASIMKIAERYDLRVVEDSCEAMFVSTSGAPVGSHGDIGCFSTFAAHFVVTGVGGLSITDDDELAVVMRSLCNHGRDGIYLTIDDDHDRETAELAEVVQRRFNFVRLGYSYRVTEMEAALGLAQLERREEILAARRRNAAQLHDGLAGLAERGILQLPVTPPGTEHSFMVFPIVVTNPEVRRDGLTFHLEKRLIETRTMLPLINQPFYVERYGDMEPRYPIARRINANGFYIGCHQGFGQQEIDWIVESFEEFFHPGR